MPKVSVIVPIYNTEVYLPACLDALLAQTFQDFEILAVNNGCTDNCARILDEYSRKDQRIHVITKEHGDIYTARNKALREASGEWIAFCDSDDTLPPKAYEHLIKRASSSSCDVVVGGFIELDEKSGRLPTTRPRRQNSNFTVLMYTPCVWNKLIRRQFLLEHDLMFPAIPMGEDMVFLVRLLKCSPDIARTDQAVYHYWQHYSFGNQSASHRYTLTHFQEHIQCHRMVYQETRNTQYQDVAAEYVFLSLAVYLKEALPRVWDTTEREKCFDLLRDHLMIFDWNGYEERFWRLFGVSFDQFCIMSAQEYLTSITELNHRKAVLAEYRSGSIGFQYILAYLNAWIGFKMKKTKKKIPKESKQR